MKHKGARSPATPQKVTAAHKQKQALELRAAGWTFDEIAAELGYAGKTGAFNAIMRGLQKYPVAAVDDLRTLENQRLDALWRDLSADFESARKTGKENRVLALFDRLLKLSERRARLNGLDKPLSVRFSLDEPLTVEPVDYRTSLAALAPPMLIEGRLSDAEQETILEAAPIAP